MKLRKGAAPRDAVVSLRERARETDNVLTAAHDSESMLGAYQKYALDTVRMLGSHFPTTEARQFVFTQRYWALQSPNGGVSRDILPTVVMDELSRAGSDGGSPSTEDESHGSTEEVSRGTSGAGDQVGSRSAA